jgi:hypothetical protein
MVKQTHFPETFNALAYVNSMQSYIGITMDETTQLEVSKLMDVAYQMASTVYRAQLDDNHFDLANVFKAGPNA